MARARRVADEPEQDGAAVGERSTARRTLAKVCCAASDGLQRLLRRCTAPGTAASAQPVLTVDPDIGLPRYRIIHVRDDRWVVQKRGATLERAFRDACSAEAFVRQDCGDLCHTLEVHAGALYLAVRVDPSRPSLFCGMGPRSIEPSDAAVRRAAGS
jgi:hypothetical protein